MNAIYLSKELSKKEIDRLNKKIKKRYKNIEIMVISENLKKNKEFMKNIDLLNIPIVDGRWLFKLLVVQVIEYIAKCQEKKLNDLEIILMANKYNDLVCNYIIRLIKIVKSLKVVSNDKVRYGKIEKQLFEEDGSILIITNNRRKALKDANIIINFDYDDEKINEFNINRNAIIVNLKSKVNINTKKFEGININFYEIYLKKRSIDIFEWLRGFNSVDIYESYLYQNSNLSNIWNTIQNDKIRIKNLIGNNGIISRKEYIKTLDKNNKLA